MFFEPDRLLDLPRPVAPDAEPEPSEEVRILLLKLRELQRVNAAVLRRLRKYQERYGSAFPEIAK
jgi:hypothetical protein